MLATISLLMIFGAGFLIYGLSKIKSIYKVMYIKDNKQEIKEEFKKIESKIKLSTNSKEKNVWIKKLKSKKKLFDIGDDEIRSIIDGSGFMYENPSKETKIKVLLQQFDFAISLIIIGVVLWGIVIILSFYNQFIK